MAQPGVRKGDETMVVSCEEVWREVSNYLEEDVNPDLRAAMDEHFRGCKGCTSILEGTRNVIKLYGDESMVSVPLGYRYRLHRRLEQDMHPSRRTFFGWMVAAAAGVLIAGGFEVARSSGRGEQLRTAHAQPGKAIPPGMMVLIYPDGKTFHVAGCTFILDQAHVRSVEAREAEREGYVPCVRCMKKYLTENAQSENSQFRPA
jgi:hypothetical protein